MTLNINNPAILCDRYAKLQHIKDRASIDEILTIADRVAAHVTEAYLDHGAILYDEHGLPK